MKEDNRDDKNGSPAPRDNSTTAIIIHLLLNGVVFTMQGGDNCVALRMIC
jgi:hypothetical protein